ncbi:hypothetical protein Tco_1176347 [Tanacetum coccineum]
MAPTARRGQNTPVNNTNPNNMTPESIQEMIDQALLRNSTNKDGSHSSYGDNRRNVQTVRPCFYIDFMKCQPLNFKGTEGVVGLESWIEDGVVLRHMQWSWEVSERDGHVFSDRVNQEIRNRAGGTLRYGELCSRYTERFKANPDYTQTLDENIEFGQDLMVQNFAPRRRKSGNKRKADDSSRKTMVTNN